MSYKERKQRQGEEKDMKNEPSKIQKKINVILFLY